MLSLATPGMDRCSTALACDVLCHQPRYDAWVASPVVEEGAARLAWPESPASGSPQSAPAEACRHGPAGVESAVSRSPDRSVPGLHSPSEFLRACSYSPSENGGYSSPHGSLSRSTPRHWLVSPSVLWDTDATVPSGRN